MEQKTNITKSFKFGFKLSEQELRRLVKTCSDHLNKTGEEIFKKFNVTLCDDTEIVTHSLEDIFQLENSGIKAVKKLQISCKSNEDYKIKITFFDSGKNKDSWESVSATIESTDRDWAFLATSDIEDRINKTKTFSFPHWYSGKWGSIIIAILWFSACFYIFQNFFNPTDPEQRIIALEAAYQNGEISNGAEAFIFYEKLKLEEPVDLNFFAFIATLMLGSYFVNNAFKWLGNKVYRSYTFYWGDEIDNYNRSASLAKIALVSILLGGIVSSIIGGLILQAFS